MYNVEQISIEEYGKLEYDTYCDTVFQTFEWLRFLKINQKAEPICLRILENGICVAVFVGAVIKKCGVRILGSPFEGWLTCNMGFVHLKEFDVNVALLTVRKFAFKELKCLYVQITDYNIGVDELASSIKYYTIRRPSIDGGQALENVLSGFSAHGRRDVRAALRKNEVEEVSFDRAFAQEYYDQLVDVFDKQNLTPFYGIDKVIDLAQTVGGSKSYCACVRDENGKSIASIMTLGYGKWAYYLGAASYRENQKTMPNEALFWSFIEYWKSKGITNFDLVGFREYKMKYNPDLSEIPVIYFERIPGLFRLKNIAYKGISLIRKVRG